MSLAVRRYDDEPGHVYRYHSHQRTYLYGLDGVGVMKVGADDRATHHLVMPGDELVIETGVIHGGVAGPDGWRYIAAAEPDTD